MKPRFLITLLATATFGAAAFLAGWLGNREEYSTFWTIVAACCLRIFMPLVLPARLAAVNFAVDVTLMSLGFVLGFWVGRERWWYLHSVVRWMVHAWMAFVVIGSPLAWWLNRWMQARRITGPYCRGCRYHLRGVTNWRCPECGRPFTLKELGVSATELRADA